MTYMLKYDFVFLFKYFAIFALIMRRVIINKMFPAIWALCFLLRVFKRSNFHAQKKNHFTLLKVSPLQENKKKVKTESLV